MNDVWTEKNRNYAWSYGWDIFLLDNGMLQIQALDDPIEVCQEKGIKNIQIFKGDYRDFLATARVYQRAGNKQNPVCLKAIRIINHHNFNLVESRGEV